MIIPCEKLDYNLTVHKSKFETIGETTNKLEQNTPS